MRAINYGSALQAYALNAYLRKQDFDVYTIDYTTESQQSLYRIFEPLNGIMALCRNIHSLINYRKLTEHQHRFNSFIERFIPTTQRFHTAEQLNSYKFGADYYICGSDQIWNANCDDFDPNYMLSFVEDKRKCISYAPSLGSGGFSQRTTDAIKKYTGRFKALSSREEAGAEIISSQTGRSVSIVADPVFLLSAEEWKEIADRKLLKQDYILGYFIGDRPGLRDFAHKMSKSTTMPVVVIYKNLRDIKFGFKNMYECGPTDFVSLVMHAKSVVTNSFHAVAFSLIFRKDFWVFTGKGNTDSRIEGILDIVGLSGRIIDNSYDKISDYLSPIHYSAPEISKLDKYIAYSKEFLLKNLS